MDNWGYSSQSSTVHPINNHPPPADIPIGFTWIKSSSGAPIGLLLALTIGQRYSLAIKTPIGIKEIPLV